MVRTMSALSRTKGMRAELEFSRLVFDALGIRAERRLEQARDGGHLKRHDVVTFWAERRLEQCRDGGHDLEIADFAIEVKRYASLTPALLARLWLQAEIQARGASKTPALAYRCDRQAWRVCVPLSAVNGDVFGSTWGGFEWAAELSLEAFCALARDRLRTCH